MGQKLFKAPGVEPEEVGKVSWLILNSFFIGIFIAALDMSAGALFLNKFGSEKISIALSASGLMGLVLASIFVALQNKMKFINLSILNLFFITVITALIRMGLNTDFSEVMIFTLFMAVGPFTIMAMLGFWGMASRMFNLRQGKRLFGLIDAGKVVAIILACLTIPIIISKIPSTADLLYISIVSGVLGCLTLIIISRKFFNNKATEDEKNKEEVVEQESASYTILFKN